MSKTEILIVDDDTLFGDIMVDACDALGHRALLAQNAEEAATTASKMPELKLAIVDVKLGNASGFDLVEQFESNHPHMHCLLLSGYGEYVDKPEGHETDAVLKKPLDLDHLSDILKAHLS